MSRRSKHKYSKLIETPNKQFCKRGKCKGLLVECYVRYQSFGKVSRELECSDCERVIKAEWRRS